MKRLVQTLKARYGTMREIAEQIGMTESGFVRGMKRGTLTIENLLDLATLGDADPIVVLRAAGKRRAAEQIAALMAGREALTGSERLAADAIRALPPALRELALADLRHFEIAAAALLRATAALQGEIAAGRAVLEQGRTDLAAMRRPRRSTRRTRAS